MVQPVQIVEYALLRGLQLTGQLVLQLHVLNDVGLFPRSVVRVYTTVPVQMYTV